MEALLTKDDGSQAAERLRLLAALGKAYLALLVTQRVMGLTPRLPDPQAEWSARRKIMAAPDLLHPEKTVDRVRSDVKSHGVNDKNADLQRLRAAAICGAVLIEKGLKNAKKIVATALPGLWSDENTYTKLLALDDHGEGSDSVTS